jgi:hypothetical protein
MQTLHGNQQEQDTSQEFECRLEVLDLSPSHNQFPLLRKIKIVGIKKRNKICVIFDADLYVY